MTGRDRGRAGSALGAVLIAGGLLIGSPARAELTMVAGNLPPHMDENGQGREADIIRAVMQGCGGEAVRFVVVPFGRHWADYDNKRYDAVSIVPTGMPLPGHGSVDYIGFQNGASVIANGRMTIRSRDDLAGRTAVTFMGGVEILGLRNVPFRRVTEQADQEIHSNLLFLHRVDVVLSDGLMMAEYNRRLRARTDRPHGMDPTQPVRFQAIFPATLYHLVFREEDKRDLFNRCYATVQASGRIDEINRMYIERYRDTVGDQYLGY